MAILEMTDFVIENGKQFVVVGAELDDVVSNDNRPVG